MADYDQKEGTERYEQNVAAELIDSMSSLEGKVVTADALHCQRNLARAIVEKGGEYLLQLKGNEPTLEQRAQAKGATPGTPFFRKRRGPRAGGGAGCARLPDRRHGRGLPVCPECGGGA